MDFQNAVEAIKQYLPDYAGEHLKRSKGKNQFVCIFCGKPVHHKDAVIHTDTENERGDYNADEVEPHIK